MEHDFNAHRYEYKPFYTVKEFAAIMCLHVNTIRKAIYNGNIYAIKISGTKNITYRIPWSEIMRWGAIQGKKTEQEQ